MNPYTQSLLARLKARPPAILGEIEEFIRYWDILEELVIRVFKGKSASAEDEAEHQEIRSWLLENYPHWQRHLEPFWRSATINGELAREDPFALVLAIPQASGFVKNWPAMQNLPAAREAINDLLQILLDKI